MNGFTGSSPHSALRLDYPNQFNQIQRNSAILQETDQKLRCEMAGLLKSLIGRTRKANAAEETEALERANQTLQFRVALMAAASDEPRKAA
jgi:hypothetical protein